MNKIWFVYCKILGKNKFNNYAAYDNQSDIESGTLMFLNFNHHNDQEINGNM